MKVCKKCGTQFPDDHNFCSSCGQRYEATPGPIPGSTPNAGTAYTPGAAPGPNPSAAQRPAPGVTQMYQPPRPNPMPQTNTASTEGGFQKFVALIVAIVGFIIAWEVNWVVGVAFDVGAAVYAYSRYKNSKATIDLVSAIVGGAAAALVILLMIAYSV